MRNWMLGWARRKMQRAILGQVKTRLGISSKLSGWAGWRKQHGQGLTKWLTCQGPFSPPIGPAMPCEGTLPYRNERDKVEVATQMWRLLVFTFFLLYILCWERHQMVYSSLSWYSLSSVIQRVVFLYFLPYFKTRRLQELSHFFYATPSKPDRVTARKCFLPFDYLHSVKKIDSYRKYICQLAEKDSIKNTTEAQCFMGLPLTTVKMLLSNH